MDWERVIFDADGGLREVHLPVDGPAGWMAVLRDLVARSPRWVYTVDDVSVDLPSTPSALFPRDGHARMFRWWVGPVELRTYFLDPEDFVFDFAPTGRDDDAAGVREFLHALALRFGGLVVAHEHGDFAPLAYPLPG